jgi:hypothetical protein
MRVVSWSLDPVVERIRKVVVYRASFDCESSDGIRYRPAWSLSLEPGFSENHLTLSLSLQTIDAYGEGVATSPQETLNSS